MNRIIPLWQNEAPYTAESPDQAQPSVKEFAVSGSRGAVVVCPGGGYEFKAPHEGDPIAEMLNRAGVSAYVLDYRVKPCDYRAPLSDASRAIRLVRSLGYEKVGILGFSASEISAAARRRIMIWAILNPTIRSSASPAVRMRSCHAIRWSACANTRISARVRRCWASTVMKCRSFASSPRK